MPYIKKQERGNRDLHIDALIEMLSVLEATRAGSVNYVVTRIIAGSFGGKKANYRALNEMIGVLECAKLEGYRRLAAPYEDQKIQDPLNGDLHEYST